MVDLRQKPYYLNEEQVKWVEDTIASMTVEEKIGQLFVNMVANADERRAGSHQSGVKYIPSRRNPLPQRPQGGAVGDGENLQEYSKIPLLIASNCEMGGNGGVNEGTTLANGAAMAAMDSEAEVRRDGCHQRKRERGCWLQLEFRPGGGFDLQLAQHHRATAGL